MNCAICVTPSLRRSLAAGALTLLLAAATIVTAAAASRQAPADGPRGQPIRPPAARLTNAPPADMDPGRIVTLPGGIVITNLPPEVLPRVPTNIIRLPTRAARKFEPLGYLPINFTILARFFINLPEAAPGPAAESTAAARWEAVRRQIPDDVLAMNGRRVALAGFILPLALENGRATEFLLLRSQSACCFGMVPRVNELVMVNVPPPGILPRPDTPMVVAGTLTVKWIGAGGQLTAIYELQADQVERAEGF